MKMYQFCQTLGSIERRPAPSLLSVRWPVYFLGTRSPFVLVSCWHQFDKLPKSEEEKKNEERQRVFKIVRDVLLKFQFLLLDNAISLFVILYNRRIVYERLLIARLIIN